MSSQKQRIEKAKVNASKNDLPQDFIDRQRAYFAEVDAFELEEEVASDEELEQMEKYMTKSFRIMWLRCSDPVISSVYSSRQILE